MTSARPFFAGLALFSVLCATAAPARADDDKAEEEDKDRTEWAAVPVLGGSTDIGVQFGAAVAVSGLGRGFRPYWWKMDALLSASIKGGPDGAEVVQQAHDMRWDIPGGASGKVRLMPAVFFDKTINSGYFGLGNAAPVVTDPEGQVGRRYQFKHQEIRTRLNIRQPLGGGASEAATGSTEWSAMYGWTLRYVRPVAYPESRLAIDAATRDEDGRPLIYGLEGLGIGMVNGGIIYDSRDDQIIPTRGSYYLGAVRLAGATPTTSNVNWMGVNFIAQKYHKLGKSPFILAGRVFVDLLAGHVPFYDLSQAGAFAAIDMPGGAQGIRGVPNGRYSGLIKVVGNVELRAMLFGFKFAGSNFKIGATTFFDTGRVWYDYSFSSPRDGRGMGLKYGAGGGLAFLWDTVALFRVDVAYSPDASAANPGFPVGIYVQEGFMF
ncbi:MAG: BamA/TamA family outer membrane protein [Labilithrix sp.]|nr:BamA/TamA family outer membrane protein [Labilithrix sp.]